MKKLIEISAMTRIDSSMLAIAILISFGFGLCGASLAMAKIEQDQDVTPEVIFGAGNTNGFFATDRRNGIELGIRAKIPFAGALNSNGDGTYSYTLAETAGDGLPRHWNFDWTVNTNFDYSTGKKLDDYTYEMGMDSFFGLARNHLTFDPITPSASVPFFDHAIGDNTTPNGGGAQAVDGPTYTALLAGNNVAQNSWRYSFFSTFPPMDEYDPDVSGMYDVYLLAKDSSGKIVARVDILVLIEVPPKGEWLKCVGFQPPMNQAYLPPALGGGEIGRKVKKNKVLPFKAVLLDGNQVPVTELVNPPEILVFLLTMPPEGIVLVDVTDDSLPPGKKTEGTQFVNSGDTWNYNLSTKNFTEVSQYYVFMESGNMSQYVIAPSCIGLFVIEE